MHAAGRDYHKNKRPGDGETDLPSYGSRGRMKTNRSDVPLDLQLNV